MCQCELISRVFYIAFHILTLEYTDKTDSTVDFIHVIFYVFVF